MSLGILARLRGHAAQARIVEELETGPTKRADR
jgi:hypothetical protein